MKWFRGTLNSFKYFLPLLLLIMFHDSIYAENFKVVIKSPLNLSIVSGKTPIDVVVLKDRDTLISKVEIFVDNSLLTAFTDPPYKIIWDAGSDFKIWKIKAVAYSADGRQTSQTVYTRDLIIDETEYVFLVNVFVSVKDQNGNFIENLRKEDFIILEDGIPQNIEKFTMDWRTAKAAIVLDSSLTMKGNKLETAKSAAIKFINALEDEDLAAVIAFDEEVGFLEDFTNDHSIAKASIAAIEAGGGTALYDAIYRTSEKMRNLKDSRKVMVLLSDGRDESTSGLEPGSLHTFNEAINKALKNEVIIYSIGVGRNLHKEMDFYNQRSVKEILEKLAFETGGLFFPAKRMGALKKAYEMIMEELRHQYSMAYSPLNESRDGKWRRIEVKVKGADYNIVTRKGYYSSQD